MGTLLRGVLTAWEVWGRTDETLPGVQVGCSPRCPQSPPCPQTSRGEPLPVLGAGRPGEWGEALEAAVVCSGRLSRRTARRPTWTLSESSWEAKNRGIRLGRERCRSVSLATPGSGPRPSCSWAGGQGRSLTHSGPRAAQPHPSPPEWSALGLGGLGPRDWYMGPGRAGAPPVQVPTGHFGPGLLGLCDSPTLTPRRARPGQAAQALSPVGPVGPVAVWHGGS